MAHAYKRFNYSPGTLVLAFVLWAALSILWSPDPGYGLLALLHIIPLIIVYFTARFNDLTWVFAVAVPIVSAMALYYPETAGYFGNENFLSEFLLVATPLALMAPRPFHWVAWVFSPVTVLALLENHSNNKWLAVLAVGGLLFLWVVLNRKYLYASLLAVCGLVGLAMLPWEDQREGIIKSLTERGEIWYNTVMMWLDAPIVGLGLGSYNYSYHSYQSAHQNVIEGTFLDSPTLFIGQAHQEYLQILAELGVIGLIPIIIMAFYVKWFSVPGLALFIGCSLALVGFPAQNPASGLAIMVALGMAVRYKRASVDCQRGLQSYYA